MPPHPLPIANQSLIISMTIAPPVSSPSPPLQREWKHLKEYSGSLLIRKCLMHSRRRPHTCRRWCEPAIDDDNHEDEDEDADDDD